MFSFIYNNIFRMSCCRYVGSLRFKITTVRVDFLSALVGATDTDNTYAIS